MRLSSFKIGGPVPECFCEDHKHAISVCTADGFTKEKLLSYWDSNIIKHFKEEETKSFPEVYSKETSEEIDSILDDHVWFYEAIEELRTAGKHEKLVKKFVKNLIAHINKEEAFWAKVNENKTHYKKGGPIPNRIYLGEQGGANIPTKTPLEEAKDMLSIGIDPEIIRQETGWFLNPHDNLWRYEISDHDMQINPKITGAVNRILSENLEGLCYPIKQLIKHDKLFKAYPDFENISICIVNHKLKQDYPNVLLFYKEKRIIINLPTNLDYGNQRNRSLSTATASDRKEFNYEGPAVNKRSADSRRNPYNVVAHELQHAVQAREAMGAGGIRLPNEERVSRICKTDGTTIETIQSDIHESDITISSGEVEACDVDERLLLNELERKNIKPFHWISDKLYITVLNEDKFEFAKGGSISENPASWIMPEWEIYLYAKKIKDKYPKVWDKGGNIRGNQSYKELEKVVKRGYWLDSEREFYGRWRSFVARHQHDFRIAGVIANLKWLVYPNIGESGAKEVIEESINKEYKVKMSQGGEVLLAPNGKQSNLTPEQYRLVRTPEFKAWFGDWENNPESASKVVDGNGEPKVMFRGNREQMGYEFSLGHNLLGKPVANNFGHFFTPDIWIAKKYAEDFMQTDEGYILEVFLSAKKVLDLTDISPKVMADKFVKYLEDNEISFSGHEQLRNEVSQYATELYAPEVYDYFDYFPELRVVFQKNNIDAIKFFENSRGGGITYVVFDSTQIKLADGTNATFDANNPDIRYSKGGNVIKGGLSEGMTLSDIASKHSVSLKELTLEYLKGIKTEMEHTSDRSIAGEIARDHLFEDKNYYTQLEKMEKKSKEKMTTGGEINYDMMGILKVISKYGWTVSENGKNRFHVYNRKGTNHFDVIIKGKSYSFEDASGTTLMKGTGQIEKSLDKLATEYFMAKTAETKSKYMKPKGWFKVHDEPNETIYQNEDESFQVSISHVNAKGEIPYSIGFSQLKGDKTLIGIDDGAYTTNAYFENEATEKAIEMMKFIDSKLSLIPKQKEEKEQVLKSDFSNPYELNKAIEAFLDEHYNQDHVSPLTSEQKAFIKQYSGYGGLEKFGATGSGLLYEYYTPDAIIQKMWGLAYKYGFKDGKSILEPSCGTGEFIKYAPKNSAVIGYEINRYSALIASILYPTASIRVESFEKNFIKNNDTVKDKVAGLPKYDLVIGNPPYGDFTGKYAGMGEKDYTKANNYIEYFITRGLDLLNSGGLLIYIVGAEKANGGSLFLESAFTEAKKRIAEKSELLEAYRLPANVFERTGVITEIIVLKKI